MSKEIHMMWDDSVLTIAPSNHKLEKFLTYKEKSLEQDPNNPWKRLTKIKTVDLYKVIEDKAGYKVIQTMQGLWLKAKNFLEQEGHTVKFYDMRLKFTQPRLDLMSGFRFSQQELLSKFLATGCSGLLGAPTRYGKCLGLSTPVLMFNGTVKFVQDIKDGDLVMGPDSKPRKVTGCIVGYGKMYKVIPNYNGMTWTCNEDHILHVQRTNESKQDKWNRAGETENLTVKDWINSTKWFKHVRKMRRAEVSFNTQEHFVPAYIYGAWLGDGHSDGITFTNAEPEVWKEIEQWATNNFLLMSDNITPAGAATTKRFVMNKGTGSTCRGTNFIKQWFVSRSKTEGIRKEYLLADRQQRLDLLAGLLDTDGESSGTTNCGFISKHKKLSEDVTFLCSSLGFGATCKEVTKHSQNGKKGTYWRVMIRGATNEIPFRVPRKKRVRKNKFNCLTVGFKVEFIGYDNYYGFELEGTDKLFLLGDCTITHNTTLIKNTIRAFPNVNTVVTVPGVDLVKQLYEDIKLAVPNREVKLIGVGSNKTPCDDINVVSMDSLYKCDADACRLLLIDEPHACVTNSRLPEITKFDKARKFGYGATLKGRFDQKDVLIEALIGPVLVERTFKEAVAEGAVCPLIVYMIIIPLSGVMNDRDQAYKKYLFKGERVAKAVKYICHDLLPKEWQTLIFIKNEDQAEYFIDWVGKEGTIAMAKRLTKKEREGLMTEMCSDKIKRCLASEIYAQGVTFNHVRALINLTGGGANTSTIQKPGRLAEVRPDKKCGVVFDFFFTEGDSKGNGAMSLCRESKARMEAYSEKGYEIIFVDSYNALETSFNNKAV